MQGSGRNKVLQCQAREMGEQEAQDEMLKPGMALFLRSVLPRWVVTVEEEFFVVVKMLVFVDLVVVLRLW